MSSPSFTAYLAAVTVVFATICGGASAATYTNHTVGGASGWFFNAAKNTTSADFSTWATSQSFNLGDFLIFNTNSNQTVIQTYNATTYDSCTSADASDSDTFIYSSGGTASSLPETFAVPLTKLGANYFFSDASDGVQCQKGMKFQIKVGPGSGLPPSLNQPPPPLYTPPPVAEPPPVFTGSGGGQGERIHNGCERLAGGAAVLSLGLGLGLSLGLLS